jgi:hypothetical protein
MCGGGGPPPVKPLTQEEMVEMTDNPFKNPNSGTEVPSWKLKADGKTNKTKKNKSKLTTSDTYQG